MGCVTSKTDVTEDKERQQYGFDQSYRKTGSQPSLQVGRHPGYGPGAGGGGVAVGGSCQFDPNKDRHIQQIRQHAGQPAHRTPHQDNGRARPHHGATEYSQSTGERRKSGGSRPNSLHQDARPHSKANSVNNNGSAANGQQQRSPGHAAAELNNTGNSSSYATTPARTSNGMTATPSGSANANFSRNQFDRSSQLRRSKKKRKKSSVDSSSATAVRKSSALNDSRGSEPPQTPAKTAAAIAAAEQGETPKRGFDDNGTSAGRKIGNFAGSPQANGQDESNNSLEDDGVARCDPKYGNLI